MYIYLLSQLRRRAIAYVHTSSDDDINDSGCLGIPISHFLKKHFQGIVIGGGSYSIEMGAKAIASQDFELLSLGRISIANPNLVEMIRTQQESTLKPCEGSMVKELN